MFINNQCHRVDNLLSGLTNPIRIKYGKIGHPVPGTAETLSERGQDEDGHLLARTSIAGGRSLGRSTRTNSGNAHAHGRSFAWCGSGNSIPVLTSRRKLLLSKARKHHDRVHYLGWVSSGESIGRVFICHFRKIVNFRWVSCPL
jgi:hypothetical protein